MTIRITQVRKLLSGRYVREHYEGNRKVRYSRLH